MRTLSHCSVTDTLETLKGIVPFVADGIHSTIAKAADVAHSAQVGTSTVCIAWTADKEAPSTSLSVSRLSDSESVFQRGLLIVL